MLRPAIRLAAVAGLLLPAVASTASAGGAWNRDDGGYYVQFGFTSLTADRRFDYDGRSRALLDDTLTLRDIELGVSSLQFYSEYGLTSWLTAVTSTQFHVAVRRAVDVTTGLDRTASASGLGDIWLGGRVRLLAPGGPLAASVTAACKIPTGTPFQDVPLGSGSVDYDLSGAVGSGFAVGVVTGYGEVSGGYRIRGRASDEIVGQGLLGVNLGKALIVQAVLDGIRSGADFDAAAQVASESPGDLPSPSEQTFLRGTLGLIYATSAGFDLDLSYGRQFLGRNTLASSSIILGVAWKR
jgi:hypothetical protein